MIQDDLSRVLIEMKDKGEITDWKVELNTTTNKYRVWFKRDNYTYESYHDIDSVEKLKESIKYHCTGVRNYTCFLCRHYMFKEKGCRKGKFASIGSGGCRYYAEPLTQMEDTQLCEALKEVEHTYKSLGYRSLTLNADIHKEMDDILRKFLISQGYDKGIGSIPYKKFGYDEVTSAEDFVEANSISAWQCMLCRKFSIINQSCSDGYDEGWTENNKCPYYIQGEVPISPDNFDFICSGILDETCYGLDDTPGYDEGVSFETIHWFFDELMIFTLESLGYTKTAKYYKEYERHFVNIPF